MAAPARRHHPAAGEHIATPPSCDAATMACFSNTRQQECPAAHERSPQPWTANESLFALPAVPARRALTGGLPDARAMSKGEALGTRRPAGSGSSEAQLRETLHAKLDTRSQAPKPKRSTSRATTRSSTIFTPAFGPPPRGSRAGRIASCDTSAGKHERWKQQSATTRQRLPSDLRNRPAGTVSGWAHRVLVGLVPAARHKPYDEVIACVEALGLSEPAGARFREPARLRRHQFRITRKSR